jgi:DNA-binding HxlR family transcriptional regulator
MPATVRYDEQYCPIARALDALGDRWTLLILRELVISDQRFTDLREHLPGIAPTLLTQRLHTMTEQGLIATKQLPAPARRSVYTATDRGRSAVPVMRALAKWGMPLLEEPSDDQVVRPWTAVNVAVATWYDPVAASGVDERYLLRVDGEEFTLSSVQGGGDPHETPDVVVESSARVWIDIRHGRLTMSEAQDRGLMVVSGSKAAAKHLQRIFHLADAE